MPIDLSNTAWVFQGTWNPTDGLLVPPIALNGVTWILVEVAAMYCSKKPAILNQFFDTAIGKVYIDPAKAIYFNKLYLIELKPILNSQIEIFCLNGSDVSIWVGTNGN